jgi:hypothetical protein
MYTCHLGRDTTLSLLRLCRNTTRPFFPRAQSSSDTTVISSKTRLAVLRHFLSEYVRSIVSFVDSESLMLVLQR